MSVHTAGSSGAGQDRQGSGDWDRDHQGPVDPDGMPRAMQRTMARVAAVDTPTQATPDTDIPETRRGWTRAAVLAAIVGGGAVATDLATGGSVRRLLGILPDKAETPRTPQTGGVITPETPGTAGQWWETFPPAGEQITGDSTSTVFKSFSDLLEWVANNPGRQTPGGLSAQQMLDRILASDGPNIGALRTAIGRLQQLDIPMHQFDILGINFGDTLPPGSDGQLGGSNSFSIVADLGFVLQTGSGSPRDPDQVAQATTSMQSIYNSSFLQYVGSPARYTFSKVDGAWILSSVSRAR